MNPDMAQALRFPLLMCVAALTLTVVGPASSGDCCLEKSSDPEDVAGKLDLALLRYEKNGPDSQMKVKLRTHEGWNPALLAGSENMLKLMLDPDEDGSADYRGRFRKVAGGGLKVVFHRVGDQAGGKFQPWKARKPNPRTVLVNISGDGNVLNPSGPVNMKAVSRFTQTPACDPASGNPPCLDRVPDNGWI
jgi:hypothetical protein